MCVQVKSMKWCSMETSQSVAVAVVFWTMTAFDQPTNYMMLVKRPFVLADLRKLSVAYQQRRISKIKGFACYRPTSVQAYHIMFDFFPINSPISLYIFLFFFFFWKGAKWSGTVAVAVALFSLCRFLHLMLLLRLFS